MSGSLILMTMTSKLSDMTKYFKEIFNDLIDIDIDFSVINLSHPNGPPQSIFNFCFITHTHMIVFS